MVEKNVPESSQAKKERFEFVFTVNGNIICQRYFRIHGFKEESLCSNELRAAIESCVELIKEDMKVKSNIYTWYTAPQVFNDIQEMNSWITNPTFNLVVPSYVVRRDDGSTYVWNGTTMEPYDGASMFGEYIGKADDAPCIFKFAFNDNGREVSSLSWDGSCYPKFVRSNIDLSNSKNKYEDSAIHAPMEEFLMNKFIADRKDIIPALVRNICVACSFYDEKDYTHYLSLPSFDPYSMKEYTVDYTNYSATSKGTYRKMVKALEAKYRKKTEAYFRGL